MVLEKQPFTRYKLEGEERPDTFTVRLNKEERQRLNYVKKIIRQPKDSTAIKQVFELGYDVIHDQKTVRILDLIFKNRKNNARLGIVEEEEKPTNV